MTIYVGPGIVCSQENIDDSVLFYTSKFDNHILSRTSEIQDPETDSSNGYEGSAFDGGEEASRQEFVSSLSGSARVDLGITCLLHT